MPRSMVIPGREHTPAYRRSIPLNHLGRLGGHTGSIDCIHLAAIKPYPRKLLRHDTAGGRGLAGVKKREREDGEVQTSATS